MKIIFVMILACMADLSSIIVMSRALVIKEKDEYTIPLLTMAMFGLSVRLSLINASIFNAMVYFCISLLPTVALNFIYICDKLGQNDTVYYAININQGIYILIDIVIIVYFFKYRKPNEEEVDNV